ALERTLAGLWEHLDKLGSKPILLAVPGNHDLVRPDGADHTAMLLGDWETKKEVREGFWKKGSKFQKLIGKAFAPYKAFWERTAPRPDGVVLGLLPGDFTYVHEKDGARFGFVGLNSAFLQLSGKDYEGKLALHPRQIQPAVERDGDLARWAAGCDACFLLTH